MKKSFCKKSMAILLCFVIALSAVSLSVFTTSAAFSGGSGTKKDPYLIKTADDLYNMRNNLSAHYKLAATIDMKGYKTDSKYFKKGFVPIGDDSTKPFTGSFTCDSGPDGLPLYAILNLNIYNAKGDLFKHDWCSDLDYPDAMGMPAPFYYETGLFGTIDGAYIANIYVLNATVYSSVVGQMDGRFQSSDEGSKISYATFHDYQATAILAARAMDSTIVHCGVSGSVKGKSSNHAGLVGHAISTNISYSYADVDVDTGGCWHIGGLVGSATSTKGHDPKTKGQVGSPTSITYCYVTGKLNASLDGYGVMPSRSYGMKYGEGAGGLVGTVSSAIIENCYADVKLSKSTRGNNFYGVVQGNPSISNCFTLGAYEGKKAYPSGNKNTSNCYISNKTYGMQADFNAASPAEITKYFTKKEGWKEGSNGYPEIAAVNIVTDKGIFVPGKERVEATTSSSTATSSTTSSGKDDTTANNSTSSTTSSTVSGNTGTTNSGANAWQDDFLNEPEQEGTTDGEQTNTESSEDAESETVTVIEGEASKDNEPDTIQFVLVVLLVVMIAGISIFTVFIIYKAVTYKTVSVAANENYDETEDEADE